MQTYDYENFNNSPQSVSCELPEEISDSESKIRNSKRHQLPVWPAHPIRQRNRQIKYKAMQMELSYAVNENCLKEDCKKQTHRKNSVKNDRWLANELVQKKIHEMMTKPIKLLSCNTGTTLEI